MKHVKRILLVICYTVLLCSCTSYASEPIEETITLTQRDVTSPEITSPLSFQRIAEITTTKAQSTIYTQAPQVAKGGYSWVAKEIDSGSPAAVIKYYDIAYNYEGEELSKTYVLGADEQVEAQPRIRQFGAVLETGTFFRPSFSRYGVNCSGCRGEYTGIGNTAIGINLDLNRGVQQADGTWKEGITWEGYYLVAASKAVPFCTILEITNHNYSGMGIVPGEPFYAIVVDRGGAIVNNRLDFYIGDENSLNVDLKVVSKKTPLAKVIRLGGLVKRNGKYSCKL